LDHAPVALYAADAAGEHALTFIGGGVERQLGFRASAFLADPGLWRRRVHPDDRRRLTAALQRLFRSGRATVEYRIRHRDGGERWFRDDMRLVTDAKGRPQEIAGALTDVSRARRAEARIRQRALLLRAAVDAVPAILSAKDRRSRYVFMNRWQAERYGTTPAGAVGKTAGELLNREHGRRTAALDKRVFATGEAIPPYEEHWVDAHGRPHVSLTTKVPLVDGRGRVANVVSVGIDIGERKRAEEALRESEARFRAFFDHSPAEIFLKDAAGRFLAVNRKCEAGWEVTEEQAKGKTAGELFGRDYAEPFERHDRAVLESGTAVTREVVVRRKDGPHSMIELKFPIRDASGAITAIGGIDTDITERKRVEAALKDSERFLHSVVENIPAMVFVKAAKDLRYVSLNRAGERIIGLSRGDVVGKTAADIFPGADARRYEVEDREALARAEVVDLPDDAIEPPRHGRRALHTRKIALRDDSGAPRYILAISEDVTERKSTAEQLLRAKEEAELANRAKSEFLANMSHELRTPLNAIVGFSDMLERETFGPLGDSRYRNYARDIRRAGSHLKDLIEDILDASKIEAGALDIHEQEFDPARAIQDCLAMLADRSKAARVDIDAEYGGPDFRLFGDLRRFKQIVLNLLSNAVKFSLPGGRVSVAAGRDAEGGFRLVVEDTGIGIPPGDLPHVAEPLRRARDSRVKAIEGAGLGLALVKSIAELHGGGMAIESELDKGTRVTVTFPRARVLPGA
jgi:PAS domain S-box-containing protein